MSESSDIVIKLIDQLPSILTAVGSLVAAIFAGWAVLQSKKNAAAVEIVRNDVNDKMQQFIEVTKTSAKAEGKLEEKDEQAVRDADAPKALIVEDIVKVELVEGKG